MTQYIHPEHKCRRAQCSRHFATERDWSHYVFSYVSHNGIAIYHCKECREIDERQYAGLKRLCEHNARQRETARMKAEAERELHLQRRQKSQQEDLWDCVVAEHLAKGIKLKGYKKYLYKQALPKELLQLARITIKVQRLIDELKPTRRKPNGKNKIHA